MAIFEITKEKIIAADPTTFEAEGYKERSDLQRILRDSIKVIAPDCYVLAEEFGHWEDSRRRIDLLCIDKDANLVVVELKRTEDAGYADLQAVRYAGMIHIMTFEEAVDAHTEYLNKLKNSLESEITKETARQKVLDFLGKPDSPEEKFAQDVRIILVSADFDREVTSTVIWLNNKGLDLQCVRIKPYRTSEKLLLDVQKIIPVPEEEDYQIQLQKKMGEEQQARVARTKRENFRFSMINLAPGTELIFWNSPNEKSIVHDDRNVKFRNEVMSLSKSAGIVNKEQGLSDSIAGTDYWTFNGKSLSTLRNEAEAKSAGN